MGLSYNPNNENIFDVTNEKTDYRTDNKTDYDTNPDTVRKTEYRWEKTSCAIYIGWPINRCIRHNRGWVAYDVPDYDTIDRHREMNEGNTQLNTENAALNTKNQKRNTAYADAISTAKTTQSGEYAIKRLSLIHI